METTTVEIRVKSDPSNPALKMKYIETKEYLTPRTGDDGKTITGLDENAVSLLQIADPKEREAARKEIKAQRLELERLLAEELEPQSSFWDKFFVVLDAEPRALDLTNPRDRLLERFLVANRYVAPSLEAIEDQEEYQNCVFYLHREAEETNKKAVKLKEKDKAVAKLSVLSEENPSKLKMIGSFIFNYNAEADVAVEDIYTRLRESFDVSDEKARKKNIADFLMAASKTPEQLMTKIILDKAVKKKFVIIKQGAYYYNDVILGSDYDEAIINLSSVEMATTLGSLQKIVKK